ncbi:MAG: response regulator transcription factor, partial [Oculatellaceae cyanobacterium Prado106]|nr:response regulator transcription factor [Oculatellaceae cyanobacterium Prado106]
MRILLIEDDEVLAEMLTRTLQRQHYLVDVVCDGQDGWNYAQSTDYDLILTDIELPRLDGVSLCQRLRSQGCTTPILLITAKDAQGDRIRGLDAGADDYLTKPLNLGELQARVRALLRRGDVAPSAILQMGALRLDPNQWVATYGEQPLNLTPKEYRLLELFLRHPSRIFSRGNLVEHLWSFDDPPQEESVKAHIKGLRQKLKAVGAVDWIENVYGVGYRLRVTGILSETGGGGDGDGAGGEGEGERGRSGDRENIYPPTHSPIHSSTHPPIHSSTHPPIHSSTTEFDAAIATLWTQSEGLMVQRLTTVWQGAIALYRGTLSDELRQA